MRDDRTDKATDKAIDLLDWLSLRWPPDFTRARWLGAWFGLVLVVMFVLALVAAAVVLVQTIGQAQNPASEGPGLGAGALIAALLGAPFLIWATVLRHQTVRYQKEGHITDRINTAVEQLGAEKTVKLPRTDAAGKETTVEETRPNIEVRIGAILSLERIAQDSTTHDRGRDHVRVMEILCAYVRENSNARPPQDCPEPEWEPLADEATEAERAAHEDKRNARFCLYLFDSKARQWAQALPEPRADIAQALQVIGRRTKAQRQAEAAWPAAPDAETVWPFDKQCPQLPDQPGEAALSSRGLAEFKRQVKDWTPRIRSYTGYRLDLRGANLQGANLAARRPDASDAVFGGALLSNARLEGADLSRARMEGANLRQAQLKGAKLFGARLEGAELSWARLEGADLSGARMEGANLRQAQLKGAKLFGARLEGADLNWARLEGAHLFGARLEGAVLFGARMEGADLSGARLEGANLREVDMDGGTDLQGAVLDRAAMQSVDLRGVRIAQAQLDAVFADGSVADSLPAGMTAPAHWPVWKLPEGGEPSFRNELARWRADRQRYRPPPPPEG